MDLLWGRAISSGHGGFALIEDEAWASVGEHVPRALEDAEFGAFDVDFDPGDPLDGMVGDVLVEAYELDRWPLRTVGVLHDA